MCRSWMVLIITLLAIVRLQAAEVDNRTFPADFWFGCATASYQVEGAWNVDGKAENIWDRSTHTQPQYFKNNDTGDDACKSYEFYKEDVEILKELGVKHYRFSISWTRILPSTSAAINVLGMNYYDNLINLLVENNIVPLVTIYHWDLPEYLEDIGGWANPLIVDYFEIFANVLFDKYGDRVKNWITFNEPMSICQQGYGSDEKAPFLNQPGIADYLCTHNLLKAHARAYHIYQDKYKASQNGSIGITLNTNHYEPLNETSQADIDAAERAYQFNFGWFAHPIYSEEGNYPKVMIDAIAERSSQEGYPTSRLPSFTDEEVTYIKGTYDFIGVNQYSTRLTTPFGDDALQIGDPAFWKDKGVNEIIDDSWETSASDWLQFVPWGMQKLMNWIKNEYGDVPIIITENGITDTGGLEDEKRIRYHQEYLSFLLKSILDDNVNVFGYTAWSCIDNFEWISGYTEKFGLYAVDFNDDNRKRTAKTSAKYYTNVISTRCLLNGEQQGTCEA